MAVPVKSFAGYLMRGIGTDGGSNLVRGHKSLFALLKKEIPSLILVRCICRALNNAASAAANLFTAHVEYLCSEVYNWVARSSARKGNDKILWKLMNEMEKDKDFHQFVKLSDTRWLVRYKVVKVICEHYFQLTVHFANVINKKTEKCFKAGQLNNTLQDNENYLYLQIVMPILYQLNTANEAFQRNKANIGYAYTDLSNLIKFLARKLLKEPLTNNLEVISQALENSNAYMPVNQCDYEAQYYYPCFDLKVPNAVKGEVQHRAFKEAL